MDRKAVVFTRHANSEEHQQKLCAESSNFYLALSVMMRASYLCNHMLDSSVAPKIITGQLRAVLNSAT